MVGILKLSLIATLLSLAECQLHILHPQSLKDSIGENGKFYGGLGNFGHI